MTNEDILELKRLRDRKARGHAATRRWRQKKALRLRELEARAQAEGALPEYDPTLDQVL